VTSIELDGAALVRGSMHIQLADDRTTHHVRIVLGLEDSPVTLQATPPQ
jgi:hypothetical protein